MRKVERIEPTLKAFTDLPRYEFLKTHFPEIDRLLLIKYMILWYKRERLVALYWKNNPDHRLIQVLMKLNIVPEDSARYKLEEIDWLIEEGYAEARDLLLWGNRYDKDGNPINLQYILIKNMNTGHIQNVLELFRSSLSEEYLEAFELEIYNRLHNTEITE